MSLSINKNLTYAGLVSGISLLVLDLLIKSPFQRRGITSNWLADYVYLFGMLAWRCAPFILAGALAGFVFRRKLSHPYLVSIFALLYVFALTNLLSLAGYVHYTLYIVLTVAVTIGLFYASNAFFSIKKFNKATKIIIAFLVLPILWVVCSSLWLYIIRVIDTQQNL